jgi:hypothetical protein
MCVDASIALFAFKVHLILSSKGLKVSFKTKGNKVLTIFPCCNDDIESLCQGRFSSSLGV